MRSTSMIILAVTVFSLTNCGDNNAATNEKQSAKNTTTESKEAQTTSSTSTGNDVDGTWKLRLEVFDDNGNRVPDEEENEKRICQ